MNETNTTTEREVLLQAIRLWLQSKAKEQTNVEGDRA